MTPNIANREASTSKEQQRKSFRQEIIALLAHKREEMINELEQRVENLESSLKAQNKKLQSNEKRIEEQTFRFDNLEDDFTEIQDQLKRSAEEAKATAEKSVKALRAEIATYQNNLMQAFRTELTTINKQYREEGKQVNQNNNNQSIDYANATKKSFNDNHRWNQGPRQLVPKIEELNRPFKQQFSSDELIDVYFYVSLVGNFGLIRRTPIQDVFKGRDDLVLKYKPHPSPRALIGQVICPRKNAGIVVSGLNKRKIEQLPPTYDALCLSPKSKHMGQMKDRALKLHKTEVLRNWERWARSPCDKAVAQLFERLLQKSKSNITKETAEENEQMTEKEKDEDDQPILAGTPARTETNQREAPMHKENIDPRDPNNRPHQTVVTPTRFTRLKTGCEEEGLSKTNEIKADITQQPKFRTENDQMEDETAKAEAMLNLTGDISVVEGDNNSRNN